MSGSSGCPSRSRWLCIVAAVTVGLDAIAGGAGVPPAAAPIFVEAAAATGLVFTHDNGAKGNYYLPEMMGAGVALFDYDNDGDLDVFLVQGGSLERGGGPATCRLFRNDLTIAADGQRTLHFTDVTEQAGVGVRGYGMGVAVGDYDNDGYLDLFVTSFGATTLLHNNGNGTFTDVTREAGVSDQLWSTSAAFVDYDRDGHLDLFVAHYVDLDLAKTPTPGSRTSCQWKGLPVMCGPRGLKGTHSSLYHNNGDGSFSDVSDKSGVANTEPYYCFTALTGDFDGDGWPDIYVSCDSTPGMLFHNNRNGTFSEI